MEKINRQVLINARWCFKVWSHGMNRFLEPQEVAATPLRFTPNGHLYFPEHSLDLVLLHYTGRVDDEGNSLIEGDVVETEQATEFGSTVQRLGVVRFSADVGTYMIDVFNNEMAGHFLDATRVKKVGNVFSNPELAHAIMPETKTEN